MSFQEIGNIFGGFLLGHASDFTHSKRSPVAIIAIIFAACSTLYLTINIKDAHFNMICIQFFNIGFMLGGVHHVVGLACAADLGKKIASGAVTGFIDGSGTLGAAIG